MITKEFEPWDRMIRFLTVIYCFFMLTLFLFYTEDGFFHITAAKSHYFTVLSLVYIGLACGSLCVGCLLAHKPIHLRCMIHKLSISDWCMLGLMASHTVTLLITPYKYESFSGNSGRYMGYGFTLLITMVYFLISRKLVYHKWLLHSFLIAAAPVSILGVINACGIDPLHFFDNLQAVDKHRYLATIGNATFFAQLMCLSLPLAAMLFAAAKTRKQRSVYAIVLFLGYCGLLVAHIDGAYIGLGAFLLYFFYVKVNDYKGLRDFLVLLTLFFGAVIFCQIAALFLPLKTEGISLYLLSSMGSDIIFCLLLLGVFLVNRKASCFSALPYAKIRKAVMITVLLWVLLIIALIIFFTCICPERIPSSLAPYLRFDDSWGSERGSLWRQLSSLYIHDFSFLQQLFGRGLDCTRIILTDTLGSAFAPFDNAHNEYLQYLVTGGLCGLILYLMLIGSFVIRLTIRHDQPLSGAIAAVVIAYAAQAITSLNQPITTPLLFLFFAIGESLLRQIPQPHQNNPAVSATLSE